MRAACAAPAAPQPRPYAHGPTPTALHPRRKSRDNPCPPSAPNPHASATPLAARPIGEASGLCRRRIDHRYDTRDPVRGESALARVLSHRSLVRREIHAVDLVAGHRAVQPLYLRSHAVQRTMTASNGRTAEAPLRSDRVAGSGIGGIGNRAAREWNLSATEVFARLGRAGGPMRILSPYRSRPRRRDRPSEADPPPQSLGQAPCENGKTSGLTAVIGASLRVSPVTSTCMETRSVTTGKP